MSTRMVVWKCDSCLGYSESHPWECAACGIETCDNCFDRFFVCKKCSKDMTEVECYVAACRVGYISPEEDGDEYWPAGFSLSLLNQPPAKPAGE